MHIVERDRTLTLRRLYGKRCVRYIGGLARLPLSRCSSPVSPLNSCLSCQSCRSDTAIPRVTQVFRLVWVAIRLMQVIAYRWRVSWSRAEDTLYMVDFAIAVRARVDSASPGASSRPGADFCAGTSTSRATIAPTNRELIYVSLDEASLLFSKLDFA